LENTKEITLSVLEDLINTCSEEYILFKTASEKITNPSLKDILNNCADEKDIIIHKLEKEITRLGGKFNVKNPLIFNKFLEYFDPYKGDMEILTLCEKMDNIVLNKYYEAMNGDILWEVVPLVAKQYFNSVNLHRRIMYSLKKSDPQRLAFS
jgi:uncharacterized protein (TIGR02284 family)